MTQICRFNRGLDCQPVSLVEYPHAQGGHFTMAKKDKKMLSLQKLASIPPVLPVISDHPLGKETAGQDKFDLCYRLGPVFDIIRYPKTAMPTTIAIYGDCLFCRLVKSGYSFCFDDNYFDDYCRRAKSN
jgi:hypothetical protein